MLHGVQSTFSVTQSLCQRLCYPFLPFQNIIIQLPPQFYALQLLEIVLGSSSENASLRSISFNKGSFAGSKWDISGSSSENTSDPTASNTCSCAIGCATHRDRGWRHRWARGLTTTWGMILVSSVCRGPSVFSINWASSILTAVAALIRAVFIATWAVFITTFMTAPACCLWV